MYSMYSTVLYYSIEEEHVFFRHKVSKAMNVEGTQATQSAFSTRGTEPVSAKTVAAEEIPEGWGLLHQSSPGRDLDQALFIKVR